MTERGRGIPTLFLLERGASVLLSRRRTKHVEKENVFNCDEMTNKELKELLTSKGVEFSERDNKKTLIELLKGV